MEIEQRLVKGRSLKKRIMNTMVVCILIPFVVLTLVLILMLLSNIDEFIGLGYASLGGLKVPMIISFSLIAAGVIIIVLFAVVKTALRITVPIIDLTHSIENITEGDLSQEITIDGRIRRNEIGMLAQSFQNLLVTMRLGNKSYYQGDMTLAFANYNAALELFKSTKDYHGQGMCLNNLGNIYRNWGDFDKAKESYDKAIEIGIQHDDMAGLGPRYNNRGVLFLSEENWTDAMNDFNKALEIDEEMGDDEGKASRKRNIGILHMLKKELDLAQEYFDEAIRLDTKWEYNVDIYSLYQLQEIHNDGKRI
ncbi:MAG: tetratricopeptide repeat protein, partial [Candidatus Thorarchaeota archaeon]